MVLVGINGLLRRQYGVVRFFFFVVSYWFIKLGSLINKWSWILRVASEIFQISYAVSILVIDETFNENVLLSRIF